ncbi:hypothetical protein [Acrocarpospora sp. B8E8]|uniref:hypothetical protein n=1 Tax=Acrocarpospora sp. B8E8 TaxID=3153572 RepID=UPI00325DEEC8
MAFPDARYDADVQPSPGGYTVTVLARRLLRDLALLPDRPDPAASLDEIIVTLLPGESATFTVTTARQLEAEALTMSSGAAGGQ